MDWARSDLLAAVALLVSAASSYVSWLAYRRTVAAQKPLLWFDVEKNTRHEGWWYLTLKVRNRSAENISVEALQLLRPSAGGFQDITAQTYFYSIPEYVSHPPPLTPKNLRDVPQTLLLSDIAPGEEPISQLMFYFSEVDRPTLVVARAKVVTLDSRHRRSFITLRAYLPAHSESDSLITSSQDGSIASRRWRALKGVLIGNWWGERSG